MQTRSPAPPHAHDPLRIGPFEVLGRLGAGAMGQVYLARSASSRLVAVKTIRADLAADPGYRERFAHEVSSARRVSGAFTAAVVDADAEATLPWLATVYVPAPSLSALIRDCGPLPVPAVYWLAAGCAEALDCIHRAGLVHRDLKPGNVLVGGDGPKVIDFGLARVDGNPHMTNAGTVMGTPSFMAPEQATGEHVVGPAADVFSLGATLLFAATGRPPYRAKSGTEALFQLMTGKPDLVDIPGELREMLHNTLARDPADRPTPTDLVDYLAPYLTGTGTAPPLPSAVLRLIEDYRRQPHLRPNDLSWYQDSTGSDDPDALGGQLPTHPSLPNHAEAPHTLHRASRQKSRTLPVALAAAGVTAVLIGGGVYLTAHHSTASPAAAQTAGAGLSGAAFPPPGNGQPPPGGGPGGPPPGAYAQTGALYLSVNPPSGDQNTSFYLHGTGWPEGKKGTVTLLGSTAAPATLVVDDNGVINYVVNQDHEFFTGATPAGTYQVRVTVGTMSETIDIVVN